MNKLEAVLFDLDGTLLDSFPDFLASLQNLNIESSTQQIDQAVVRAHVSDGSSKLLNLVFNIDTNDESFEEHKRNFLTEYEKNILMYGNLFHGISDLLNFLIDNKIPYGIVTNKPRKYTEIILKKSSLLRQSKVVICCDDGFKSKPNPEGINHACNVLGVQKSKCIYIGDHMNDLNASLSAGTISGICSFGYGFDKETQVDGVENFNSPIQILDFIKQNV